MDRQEANSVLIDVIQMELSHMDLCTGVRHKRQPCAAPTDLVLGSYLIRRDGASLLKVHADLFDRRSCLIYFLLSRKFDGNAIVEGHVRHETGDPAEFGRPPAPAGARPRHLGPALHRRVRRRRAPVPAHPRPALFQPGVRRFVVASPKAVPSSLTGFHWVSPGFT